MGMVLTVISFQILFYGMSIVFFPRAHFEITGSVIQLIAVFMIDFQEWIPIQ